MEPIKPSVWRKARRNTARIVNAVRIARGQYQGCPPAVAYMKRAANCGASRERHYWTRTGLTGIAKVPSETTLTCGSRSPALVGGFDGVAAWAGLRQDLQDRMLACSELTLREVAVWLGGSASYVSKVRARLRCLGDAGPGSQHNHVPPRLAPVTNALRAQIKADPDPTLRELRGWVAQQHGVRVSHPVMWTVVARLGLTLKNTCAPPSRIARTSNRPARPGPSSDPTRSAPSGVPR